MGLVATYFGANGWLLEFGAMRVLVDPWLRGSLSFPPGPWLLKGELPKDQVFPLDIDLILLTQGIDLAVRAPRALTSDLALRA